MSMNKVNMSLDEIIKKGRSNQRKDNNNFRRRSRNPNQNQGMLRRRNFGGERRRGSNRMNNRSSFENNPKFFNRQNRQNVRNFRRRRIIRGGVENRNKGNNKTRLFISNLQTDIVNSELKTIFSKIGPLKRCGIHWDIKGNSKGCADIEYENPNDAAKAIEEFDKAEIEGMAMSVKYSDVSSRRRVFKRRLGMSFPRRGENRGRRNRMR